MKVEDIMKAAGVNPGAVQQDMHALAPYIAQDVGAVISQLPCLAQAPQEANQLIAWMSECIEGYKRGFANALALVHAQFSQMPNAAVTLLPEFGPDGGPYDPGDVFPPGAVVNLVPYIGGAKQVTFKFLPEMTLLRIFAGQIDADAGWRILGESFKLTDQVSSAFKNDVSLHAILPNSDFQTSPYGWLQYRSPITNQDLTCKVFLNNADEQPFLGITIIFHDRRCKERSDDGFAPGAASVSWTDLVDYVYETCTGTKPPRARPQPAPYPGIIPTQPRPTLGTRPPLLGTVMQTPPFFAGTLIR